MSKLVIKHSTVLIAGAVLGFIAILGAVFYLTYKFATRTDIETKQAQLTAQPVTRDSSNQQVQRVVFKNIKTGEIAELFMDGRINQYDKHGKLIKSGRRGFAETQTLLRLYEKMINGGQAINGKEGFEITIETEQGTIVIPPGDNGGGNSDDLYDYIDHTLNPTPVPTPRPTPVVSPGHSPLPPTPTPSPNPDEPLPSVKPFECSDYYSSGRPMKISGTICGDLN